MQMLHHADLRRQNGIKFLQENPLKSVRFDDSIANH